ncbi:MAG: hypothetical protein QM785_08595 [Pyrinomonadaceae bacterium]
MTEQVLELSIEQFDPEPNVPEPVLVKSELVCYLIYSDREGERKALKFLSCSLAKFGYPNDEGLGGHPLYSKGLSFYGCFEVINSEWIEELRQNNKTVYPDREIFAGFRHFIFSFHDSTFECIAKGVELVDKYPQVDNSAMKVYGI